MEEDKIDRIVQLDIEIDGVSEEELEDFGVEIVSLVSDPAIGIDFQYFAEETSVELESYTDYPQAATNNAKRALKWAEENGWGSCGTPVGKRRANQLANREPISEETIARMSAFRRQQQNKNTPYDEGCGGLMWDAWGGDAGIDWAEKKLARIRREEDKAAEHTGSYSEPEFSANSHEFSVDNDERVVVGPLMIPNKMILRREEDGSPYYIFFTKQTIRKMREKFLKLNKHNNTDTQHSNDITTSNTMLESWISEDKYHDKSYKYGFALPIGTWFVSYKINNDETWQQIKSGELKGFSLAGPFIEKLAKDSSYTAQLSDIIKILEQVTE